MHAGSMRAGGDFWLVQKYNPRRSRALDGTEMRLSMLCLGAGYNPALGYSKFRRRFIITYGI